MKRANGTGSVIKLSDNRRNPWYARIPTQYDKKGKALPTKILSDENGRKYFPDRTIPDLLLAKWNIEHDVVNVDKSEYTFAQVYEEFAKKYFPTKEEIQHEKATHEKKKGKFGMSNASNLKSAYKKCDILYDRIYKSLRTKDFEEVILSIKGCKTVLDSLPNLFRKLDAYAYDEDIIIKTYANSLRITEGMYIPTQNKGTPYSYEEIDRLWDYEGKLVADITLSTIYTGARIEELLFAKISDVYLKEGYFIAGLKTKSGKRRIIPIHHELLSIFTNNYIKNKHNEFLFTIDNSKIDYDTQFYRMYVDFMDKLGMEHDTHDGRKTLHSELERLGANKVCTDMIFGHKSENFGDALYTKKSIEELKETIELVDYRSKKNTKITYLKMNC